MNKNIRCFLFKTHTEFVTVDVGEYLYHYRHKLSIFHLTDFQRWTIKLEYFFYDFYLSTRYNHTKTWELDSVDWAFL